jgi:glycosyltransferase involved in cell wall biosynthesis
VQYIVNESTRGKFGEIDWERKLKLQRPRQTLSASIIAGPNSEETLHWNLRSLINVADEVVIADCGLSEEALRIIDTYKWKEWDETRSIESQREARNFLNIRVVPGIAPQVAGFETARNIALAACTQDWVLWIDTDEKVLQSEQLNKYLKPNMFQGYSIRQHHFAVDTTFDSDMPVRCFRNNGKLRFFGMIHEHPEAKLNEGPGMTIIVTDVHIPHLGYLIESGRQQRFNRNWPLLEKDIETYPDRRLQKHFIMRDEMMLASFEFQQNGNQVTESIRQRCRKVIEVYREHFLGKGHFANIDPVDYYSQACTFLGIGFDTQMVITADKIEARPTPPRRLRYADEKDFLADISNKAANAVRPFSQPYF